MEELKNNLTEEKKKNLKELPDLKKKIMIYDKMMNDRKEGLIKKFFNTDYNQFYSVFQRFYHFLHLLKVFFYGCTIKIKD